MKSIGRVTVLPAIPKPIEQIRELADNLRWTWNPHASRLFERLDPVLWSATRHNPVLLLQRISQERLDQAANDAEFVDLCRRTVAALDQETTEWFAGQHGEGDLYAYFCAEYGWHESLPLYSGGLGVLAGDHTKASSDLGVPLVGVGLWYPEGYFHQTVAVSGEQQAVFERLDPGELPLRLVRDEQGNELRVTVSVFGREVSLRAWRVDVGRVAVYLLDCDVEENLIEDRNLLQRLYGGDQGTRIAQEVILGVGGVRLLRKLKLAPSAWHMNEGHSAFMALERCRELTARGLSFEEAREVVTGSTVFTVHTPVAAGNDGFPFELVDTCFSGFWRELGISREAFLDLGRADHGWGPIFSMPALALRFSSGRNGVSELHGETSRLIWSDLWPEVPPREVPIGHVTNGVHVATWMAPEIADLVGETLAGDWRQRLGDEGAWSKLADLDLARLWEVRRDLKQQSVRFLRKRLLRQLGRQQASAGALRRADRLFDPEILTIGFARRFATYKRATLILTDLDRLARLLGDAQRPVQLVFAGKAHPADRPGQELISHIHRLSGDPRFSGRILFVEDYDLAVGRALTRGVDVWLNNPRRPLEASGTSGQKAAMNGVLNLSIKDGWWPEGFNGENGWAFGGERSHEDEGMGDRADAEELYALLEEEVVPLYYRRDEHGVPREWMQRARDAIASITPRFNAQRMVGEYVTKYYAPASRRGRRLTADDHAGARELAKWRKAVREEWNEVYLSARPLDEMCLAPDETLDVEAILNPGRLEGIEVRVEAVYGPEEGELHSDLKTVAMQPVESYPDGGTLYRASFRPEIMGPVLIGVRAYPVHELLASPFDAFALRWA